MDGWERRGEGVTGGRLAAEGWWWCSSGGVVVVVGRDAGEQSGKAYGAHRVSAIYNQRVESFQLFVTVREKEKLDFDGEVSEARCSCFIVWRLRLP